MSEAQTKAFLNSPVEVFNTVAAVSEIWTFDPLDVREIHLKARKVFERLVHRAVERRATPDGDTRLSEPGRVLVLTGEAGCGKTHLLRAFRNWVHGDGFGFVGYLQLTTSSSNYARYILNNLIDSLSQPYNDVNGSTTGLMQLATVLVRSCGDEAVRARLLNPEEQSLEEVIATVEAAIEALGHVPRYRNIDVNLLRALMFLHADDQLMAMRVMRYLRCEPLTPADSAALGNIAAVAADEAPERMLKQLGELIRSTGRCLVICVDQLEGAIDEQMPAEAFRRLMQTIGNLASQIESSVFVVACLSDFYAAMRPHLTRSIVDRIESNPPRQHLEELCTADEAELLVKARLKHLYEASGIHGEAATLFPFKREEIRNLAGQRTRDVVLACLRYRQRAQSEGRLPEALLDAASPPRSEPPPPPAADPAALSEVRWNEFRSSRGGDPPLADEAQADALLHAILASEKELGWSVKAKRQGGLVEIELSGERAPRELVVYVCNKETRGGALTKELAAFDQAAGARTAIFVRATELKRDPKTVIGQKLDAFERRPGGGRLVVVQNADFRTMIALRAFEREHPNTAGQAEWRRQYRPLLRLASMQAIMLFEPARSVSDKRKLTG